MIVTIVYYLGFIHGLMLDSFGMLNLLSNYRLIIYFISCHN